MLFWRGYTILEILVGKLILCYVFLVTFKLFLNINYEQTDRLNCVCTTLALKMQKSQVRVKKLEIALGKTWRVSKFNSKKRSNILNIRKIVISNAIKTKLDNIITHKL